MARTIINAKKFPNEEVANIVFAVVSDKDKQPNKDYQKLAEQIIYNKGNEKVYETVSSSKRLNITGSEIPKICLLLNDGSLFDKKQAMEQGIKFQDGYGMPFGYEGIAAYVQVRAGFGGHTFVNSANGIIGNCKKYVPTGRNPKLKDELPTMKYIQDCCEMLAAQIGETLAEDDRVYKMNSLEFPFSNIFDYDKQTTLFFNGKRIPEYEAPAGYSVLKCISSVLDPTLVIVNSFYAGQGQVHQPQRNEGEYFLCANEFVNWWIENEYGEIANPDEYTEWNIDYRKCHEYEKPENASKAETEAINSFIEYLNAN